MGQGGGEIHLAAASQGDLGVFRDQVFAECGQGDRELDGRAGLRTARKCQFLVHHGQHPAAVVRLDRRHGAVHIAQSVDRGCGPRSSPACALPCRGCFHEGTGGQTFIVAMAPTVLGPAATAVQPRLREPVTHFSARGLSSLFVISVSGGQGTSADRAPIPYSGRTVTMNATNKTHTPKRLLEITASIPPIPGSDT